MFCSLGQLWAPAGTRGCRQLLETVYRRGACEGRGCCIPAPNRIVLQGSLPLSGKFFQFKKPFLHSHKGRTRRLLSNPISPTATKLHGIRLCSLTLSFWTQSLTTDAWGLSNILHNLNRLKGRFTCIAVDIRPPTRSD